MLASLPGGIRLDSNDLGGLYHRKVTSLRIPEVSIKVLLSTTTGSNRWLEAGEFLTDLSLDIYTAPDGYRDMARAQTAYVEDQDRLTGRARQMFAPLRPQDVDSHSSSNSCLQTKIIADMHFRSKDA